METTRRGRDKSTLRMRGRRHGPAGTPAPHSRRAGDSSSGRIPPSKGCTGMMTLMRIVRLTSLLLLAVSCRDENSSTALSSTPATAPSVLPSAGSLAQPKPGSLHKRLVRVEEASKVCMVTDRYMGKPQIPVQVGGRTYYGCCPMCEGKLRDDSSYRTATDPFTGNSVNKAGAVLARTRTNKIYYFESEETFQRYASRQ